MTGPRDARRRTGRSRAGWIGLAMLVSAVPAMAGELRLPAEIQYASGGASPGPVVFSHRTHVAFSAKCTACHNVPFRMLKPTRAATHAEMEAGRSCGICHNDAMAFGPKDPAVCGRCHGGGKP